MLAIAGQTTEPNWLKYFEEIKFQNYNFFIPRATQCTSASFQYFLHPDNILIKLNNNTIDFFIV